MIWGRLDLIRWVLKRDWVLLDERDLKCENDLT